MYSWLHTFRIPNVTPIHTYTYTLHYLQTYMKEPKSAALPTADESSGLDCWSHHLNGKFSETQVAFLIMVLKEVFRIYWLLASNHYFLLIFYN